MGYKGKFGILNMIKAKEILKKYLDKDNMDIKDFSIFIQDIFLSEDIKSEREVTNKVNINLPVKIMEKINKYSILWELFFNIKDYNGE